MTAIDTTDAVTITGEFQRVVVEKGAWFVGLMLDNESGERVSFSGTLAILPPIGSELAITGTWQDRGQYGMQLKAERIAYSTPTTREGALRVLKTLPGIGASRAQYLVDTMGADQVIKRLLDDPDQLASVPGIGKQGAQAVAALREQRDMFEVEAQLSELGLGSRTRARAIEHFGGIDETREVLASNPYRLVEVERVSFRAVDDHLLKIQRFAPDSPFRATAAIVEALKEQGEKGHTWVPRSQIGPALDSLKLGNPVPTGVIETALEAAVKRDMIRLVHGPHAGDEAGYAAKHLDRAESIVAEYFARLLDAKPLPISGSLDADVRAKLTDEQERAVDLISTGNLLVVTGKPGTGKCLRPGTRLLMFDGTVKAVEDVRIGELLMGDDSTPRKVLGLSHGHSQMFEVIPRKGESFGINENHILTYKIQQLKELGDRTTSGHPFTVKDVPVKAFLASSLKEKEKAKLYRVGVEWPERHVPIDPYFLGVWLGDGDNHRVGFTTPDHEIVSFLHEFAEKFEGVRVRHEESTPGRPYQYHLTTGNNGRKNNPILNILRSLKVMRNKHVPLIYKANGRNIRLQVLAGLIDTDGYYDRRGNCFEFTSKDEYLFDDLLFLARSLGLAAYKAKKIVNGETYFRGNISGDIDIIPTRVARKQARPRKQVKNVLHTGFSIVEAGFGEYYGVEVDGNHRHLLADFTVVHNTFTTRAILDVLGRNRTMIIAPTGKAAKRASELTGADGETIHRLAYRLLNAVEHGEATPEMWPRNIIIDEASMLSVDVAAMLLSALDPGDVSFPLVRIVLVGDVDQLPPIGPGAVLRDCLSTQAVPCVRLTKIHRQAEGSDIVTNAHRIINGEKPVESPGPTRKEWYQVYAENGDNDRIARAVVELHARTQAVFGIDPREIMVLSPQRAGPVGINALNDRLRAVLNPPSNDPTEPIVTMPFRPRGASKDAPKVTLRRGDRVLVTANNYNLGVVNGDLGVISEVIPGGGKRDENGKLIEDRVVVTIDGGTEPVTFRGDDIWTLAHAYCMSTHKAQGSESRAVITVVSSSHYRMLSRRHLYTTVTRARELLVLVYDPKGLAMALRDKTEETRRTRLAGMLAARAVGRKTL